jgi:hypothetical protein
MERRGRWEGFGGNPNIGSYLNEIVILRTNAREGWIEVDHRMDGSMDQWRLCIEFLWMNSVPAPSGVVGKLHLTP